MSWSNEWGWGNSGGAVRADGWPANTEQRHRRRGGLLWVHAEPLPNGPLLPVRSVLARLCAAALLLEARVEAVVQVLAVRELGKLQVRSAARRLRAVFRGQGRVTSGRVLHSPSMIMGNHVTGDALVNRQISICNISKRKLGKQVRFFCIK